MQGVDVLCENMKRLFFINAIAPKLLLLCIYRKSYKNFDLCMAFCTYIKYNQDNERYMHRKEGLYAVKQLFRIS